MSADIIVMPGCKPRYLEEPAPEPEWIYSCTKCGGEKFKLIVSDFTMVCLKCGRKPRGWKWGADEVRFDDGA
jgi:hypothetical protein